MTTSTDGRRRYAVAGTGSRAAMYVDAMLGEHADVAVPVAWCDTNEVRMAYYDAKVREAGLAPVHFHPDDLSRMLSEQQVDVLIVTSPDHTHAEVVTRALAAGVDVICEKPLTIDAEGLRAIESAARESSARLILTFNYRYSPRNSALREVIAAGTIGRVVSVHFEWMLDTVHGADYFRRWHRDKRHSGGLAVHKAAHHFDLVNWWIDDVPETVHALGGLHFYGAEGAGHPGGSRSPLARDTQPGDPYGLDMAEDDKMRELFLTAEHADGYLRDRDVFAPGVSIEDTLSVLVGYRSGASMTYSLTAHSPLEGYRVSVNGTRGRAELEVVERSHTAGTGRSQTAKLLGPNGKSGQASARLTVQKHWEVATEIPIPEGSGAHGGGDILMLRDIFRGSGDDPLRRQAGYVDGLRSAAVGVATNQSLRSGAPASIAAPGLVEV